MTLIWVRTPRAVICPRLCRRCTRPRVARTRERTRVGAIGRSRGRPPVDPPPRRGQCAGQNDEADDRMGAQAKGRSRYAMDTTNAFPRSERRRRVRNGPTSAAGSARRSPRLAAAPLRARQAGARVGGTQDIWISALRRCRNRWSPDRVRVVCRSLASRPSSRRRPRLDTRRVWRVPPTAWDWTRQERRSRRREGRARRGADRVRGANGIRHLREKSLSDKARRSARGQARAGASRRRWPPGGWNSPSPCRRRRDEIVHYVRVLPDGGIEVYVDPRPTGSPAGTRRGVTRRAPRGRV